MKLLALLVFCGVLLGLINSQQSDCPPECECDKKNVKCIGHSMANVTAKVPNDTVSYLYTAIEYKLELGLVDFSHLPGLTTLHINTLYDDYVFQRLLSFNASHQSVFKSLSNLEILKININWNMSEPMPEMFSYLTHLRVLDLSNTRYINYTSLQQSFKGLQHNHNLSTIALKHTQSFQVLQNGMTLDLSNLLKPLAHCPIEHLDISYNSLKTVYPGLLRFAPKLKTLVIANNLLTPLITTAFFFEVILHPTLETADFRQQGRRMLKPTIRPASIQVPLTTNYQRASEKMDKPTAGTDFLGRTPITPQLQMEVNKFFIAKLPKGLSPVPNNSFSQTNTLKCFQAVRVDVCQIYQPFCTLVLETFQKHHIVFCIVMQSVFEELFGGIPCEYFPNITDLLAEPSECGGCVIFSTAGNVRIMKLSDNSYYDPAILSPNFVNKTKCFHPNKIETMDVSNNYPYGFADIAKIFEAPITGFNNLKVAQLANCGLKRPYFNLSASFPNLEQLDLSNNELVIEADATHPYLIGPPTVKVLRLTANGINKTPENALQTMTALEELHINDNHLQEFTMNLTRLPYLVKLNLQGNYITSVSKNMMGQFDAHAQQVNHTVEIDLRGNQLLCTCNEQHFVRWLQTNKHHDLHFLGMNNYTCMNDQSNIVTMLDVNLDNMALHCLSPYVYVSISAASALILAALILVFGTCAYRKRWWFRYRYYLITRMYRQQQQREEAQRNYQYDAFVSYNSRDELWINDELQPKLEDEFGLKLCLHERDFVLGANIIEQISSSIENSRKTLLILSPNFLASTWCHWEMNLAHNRLLSSGQDVLLLAILSPMSKVKMSRVLKDLLEKKTYVMWTDDRDGQKLFWEKLQQAIRADRTEPYDLEDGHSWEETRPLLVNEQARGAR